MKDFVAVSQRVDDIRSSTERQDSLDKRVVLFLKAVGLITLPVPNNLFDLSESEERVSPLESFLRHTLPTAVLLSGGNDIGEHEERDITEYQLLDYAEKYKLPVLGICRGMQLMATRAGAKLRKVSGHVQTRHKVDGIITAEVNSYHNYAIDNCPKNYTVLAKSQDQTIEAIQHDWLPWEGWMWHPEREIKFAKNDIDRAGLLLRSNQKDGKNQKI
jgi:putative glutamine amidotransferase